MRGGEDLGACLSARLGASRGHGDGLPERSGFPRIYAAQQDLCRARNAALADIKSVQWPTGHSRAFAQVARAAYHIEQACHLHVQMTIRSSYTRRMIWGCHGPRLKLGHTTRPFWCPWASTGALYACSPHSGTAPSSLWISSPTHHWALGPQSAFPTLQSTLMERSVCSTPGANVSACNVKSGSAAAKACSALPHSIIFCGSQSHTLRNRVPVLTHETCLQQCAICSYSQAAGKPCV